MLIALLVGFMIPAAGLPAARVLAFQPPVGAAKASGISAYDLIIAMNTLRVSYGLPALVEDPIIDAVAQQTANTMAAQELSWHIGNVSGRVQAAGYGGGSKVWATENFAMGHFGSIDEIMQVWSDPSHMIPAVNKAYCNIGAGTAKSPNGYMYYVLQAAYTADKSCGEYKSVGGATLTPGGSTTSNGVSELVVPVKIATPGPDGKIFHVVQAGQSFWSIAIAYKITIHDIEVWNNISRDSKLQVGQKLFIPSSNTAGYSTPTPVGMIQVSSPDKDGKVIHVVQAYQTLSTISQAYGVNVNAILSLNGIQVDWPLQIGQKLVIHASNVTPSPTPRPLTPIQRLTPASDGNYYHIVKNGETIAYISGLYGVNMYDLLSWNGLDSTSIIQPGQKLLLKVTPPVPPTPTPAPATATLPATVAPPTETLSPTPSQTAIKPSATTEPPPAEGVAMPMWLIPVGLIVGGVTLAVFFTRGKK